MSGYYKVDINQLHKKVQNTRKPFRHQEEAFKNITSLTISNLSELKYLTIENHSFSSTTIVTLSSIIYSYLFH